MLRIAALSAVLLAACSSGGGADGGGADRGSDLGGGRDSTPSERPAALDARADAPRDAPTDGPTGLPFTYTRPPAGTPLSAAELAAVTDKYLDLLQKTNYLQFVDERVHGWPQSDAKKRYWYGTWWVDMGIHRHSGEVSFVHTGGADNNGIPTAAVLEGACFVLKQWPSTQREQLVRRLIRGMHSWIMAMERQANDPIGVLLARSAYPESITSTDGGTFAIDYAAGRPGPDTYVDFVHLPTNPHWGDLYIKNKRSKDDIGHMLRAIATLDDCASGFTTDTHADDLAMRASYSKWSQRVETDGWGIATLDKNANLFMPPIDSTMSHFYGLGNAECDAMLTIRLQGHGDPGAFSCGDGIHPLEWAAMTNDHNGEIVRAFHEAAVRQALMAKRPSIAQAMLPGLAKRIDDGVTLAETNKLPVWLSRESLADMILHSANTGVPLTWREVRWLHGQLEIAYTAYVTNTPAHLYRMFDAASPEGEYASEPDSKGIHFTSLALLVGACTAKYRNPAGMPLLDCARLTGVSP